MKNNMNEIPKGTPKPMSQSSSAESLWVHEVLESNQLTKSKIRLERRKLGRGTIILLWALRAYVVLMIVIVVLAVHKAIHGGN
jgi:hypothetical protein